MQGDWRKAYNYLASLTSWNLVPAKDSLLAMLRSKLQEEARPHLLAPCARRLLVFGVDILSKERKGA